MLSLRCRFLTHVTHGVAPDPDLEAIIANVEWYGRVADSHVAAPRSRVALGCPIFRKSYVDDKAGNLWPVQGLGTCGPAGTMQSACCALRFWL